MNIWNKINENTFVLGNWKLVVRTDRQDTISDGMIQCCTVYNCELYHNGEMIDEYSENKFERVFIIANFLIKKI